MTPKSESEEKEMPKFKRDMIRGVNSETAKKEQSEKIQAGAGLISDVSRNAVKMKIEHVSRGEIDKNINNHYSIKDVESLAWSIRTMGLLQPLHVTKKADGRYLLLGGERRITAIDSLIADPEVEDWNEDSLIPVVVKDTKDIDLPLSNELKETLSIVTTNKEARKYTDGDRLQEIRDWKKIIQALREAGIESFPSVDESGESIEIQIHGEKTRDVLAKTTGLSRGLINSYEKVENQGSNGVLEALLNNQITVKTATDLIDKADSQEHQEEILHSLKKEGKAITKQNIDAATEEEKIEIEKEQIEKEFKELLDAVDEQAIDLNRKELKIYEKAVRDLKKLLIRK